MNIRLWVNVVVVCAALIMGLYGCQFHSVTPQMVEQHLKVLTPEGSGPFPVVIYYQGTGADYRRPESWANWFRKQGVASAIVNNAIIRGRSRNPSGSRYTVDGALAWDILRNDPRIDTTRFALMGFSRGGQMALDAGHHFAKERHAPDFVFALYPGGWGKNRCNNNHGTGTDVHFFFGELDNVCQIEHNDAACRAVAARGEYMAYHEIKNATHGYDDTIDYVFKCCNPSTRVMVVPNPTAVAETRRIILEAITKRWGGLE